MTYTKKGLMRKLKSELLTIASSIEFVSDEMTKDEIADAILIMGVRPGAPGAPGAPGSSEAKSETAPAPAPDDSDYPRSVRIRRARGEDV